MSVGTEVNTMEFINDIASNPLIWNRDSVTSKLGCDEIWRGLSTKYNAGVPQLKAKWKGLRDMFRVELRRVPVDENNKFIIQPNDFPSRWLYFRSLVFLVDHMRTREPKSRPTEKVKSIDALAARGRKKLTEPQQNACAVKVEAGTSDTELAHGKRKTPDSPVIMAANESQKRHSGASAHPELVEGTSTASGVNAANTASANETLDSFGERGMNDDYHFLLSLQPFMAELSSIQKLRVRMEMQKLIFDELCSESI